ncbi:hypothetical protein SFC43_35745 [Bacteroides sp. CR5/BHMF/2]|nr:hypothetical protein [Bacteroides sp. CR5/BHMF/2]
MGKATPNKKVAIYTSWNAQQQEVNSNKREIDGNRHNSGSWRSVHYSYFRR